MYVEASEVLMSRVQLALNVDDLDQSIAFYTKLFGTGPAKVKPGYANFAVADPALKLVLLENPGQGGSINHLGVEVDSSEKVHAEIARLTEEQLFTEEEIGATCCFATQPCTCVRMAREALVSPDLAARCSCVAASASPSARPFCSAIWAMGSN